MNQVQSIPAGHGIATFVSAGQTLKVINTSGSQVIELWAFVLPDAKHEARGKTEVGTAGNAVSDEATHTRPKTAELPDQDDAEAITKQARITPVIKETTETKSTWSSYVKAPTLKGWSKKDDNRAQHEPRTWSSYIPSGKAVSAYVPKSAAEKLSAFASSHYRDPDKSVVEQLQDFSKTPVGAAGLAAMTGSGYAGTMYAGYQAYQQLNKIMPVMEYMSMDQTRARTFHLSPIVDDVLLSNLREPVMTLIEDTSTCAHDTLMPACGLTEQEPATKDQTNTGHCTSNLVTALQDLNDRAGLKAAKAIGAEVTAENAPVPLSLFMDLVVVENELRLNSESKAGAFVRLQACRDVVVVMSSCPHGQNSGEAHFVLEGGGTSVADVVPKAHKRVPPRKLSSFRRQSASAGAEVGTNTNQKPSERVQKAAIESSVGTAGSDMADMGVYPEGVNAEAPASKTTPRKKPRKLSSKPRS